MIEILTMMILGGGWFNRRLRSEIRRPPKEGELENQPEINFDAWRFLHARKIYERSAGGWEKRVSCLREIMMEVVWMIWLKIYSIALWAWRRKSILHAIIVGKCKNKWRRKWRNDRWFRRLSEQLKFGLRKPLEMNMGSVDDIDFVSFNMTWLHVGGHEWYSFIESVILWLTK